ncbi:MAG: hypothetical protein AAF291_08270 [Pseudomonadota bacterium]
MRLAGLGVLALFLVGILIFLGQSGAFDGARERPRSDEAARFDDANKTVLANLDTDGSAVFGAPVIQDTPLILSGLPSYAGLQFRLPVDARPTSGDFDLLFTSLVAEDVEGVLRVSINGVKRADYLLNQGEQTDRVQVQLTPAELASGVITIGLSLQGRGPIAECTGDDAIAAVVTVNGASGLQLNLSDAPASARDRLALWGDRVPVALSGADDANIIHQAAILSEKGYSPIISDNGVALEALRSLAGEAARRNTFSVPAAYPITLSSDPVNKGLRKFTRRVNWRYAYNAAQMPDGRLPSALDLRLQVGPATDQLQRDLVVTLNDSLLFSRRIANGTERVNQSIALPAQVQSRINTLDISVSAYDAQDLRCGDIAQSVAQLLPETVLQVGDALPEGELAVLRAAMIQAGNVSVKAQGLSAPDAAAAIALLSALSPSQWAVSAGTKGARVQTVPNGAAAARLDRETGMSHWIVYRQSAPGKKVSVQRLPAPDSDTIEGTSLVVSVHNASHAAQPSVTQSTPQT